MHKVHLRSGELLIQIGGRCHAFLFLKTAGEVGGIVESAFPGRFRDAEHPGRKDFAGTLDPVIPEIVDRRPAGVIFKQPAEVVRVQAGGARNIIQFNTFLIMFLNKGKCIFDRLRVSGAFFCFLK